VLVAAVALVDADGRVLLAERPAGKSMAGLWEFPGGKVNAGETPEAALIRELAEELGIDVTASCLAPFTLALATCPPAASPIAQRKMLLSLVRPLPEASSSLTPSWRKTDSNHRSLSG
jgi:8-oxo-dGTP pyrophosphatase MutT (NUDIX family)